MTTQIDCGCCEMNADRAKWGDGSWTSEPNYVPAFEHAGLLYILHRGGGGAWCGYVGVPPGHPAHGKGYDEVDVSVHGGLTYANKCSGHVCHVAAPGEPDDIWWLGFDCNHSGDVAPAYRYSFDGQYCDLEYVTKETKDLAEQLAAMKS